MRNYVNTDDELKLLYELTGLARLLSVELIQTLLGCSQCRLPDPRAYGHQSSGRGLRWMGSTYFSKSLQCSLSPTTEICWQQVQQEQETSRHGYSSVRLLSCKWNIDENRGMKY